MAVIQKKMKEKSKPKLLHEFATLEAPPGNIFLDFSHICLIISKIKVRFFAKKGLRDQNIVFHGQYSHFRLPDIHFD